jgi:hypothetical protein
VKKNGFFERQKGSLDKASSHLAANCDTVATQSLLEIIKRLFFSELIDYIFCTFIYIETKDPKTQGT